MPPPRPKQSAFVEPRDRAPFIADIDRWAHGAVSRGSPVEILSRLDWRFDCSIRKEEPPDGVRGFVVQMLFGRSVELIVQPNAHDVEVGTASPVKHETSIALSVRCQKHIEIYRQPFCTRT